jgi:hypothetical protein
LLSAAFFSKILCLQRLIPYAHQVYDLERRVFYRNCTALAMYDGFPIVTGVNDSVRVITIPWNSIGLVIFVI